MLIVRAQTAGPKCRDESKSRRARFVERRPLFAPITDMAGHGITGRKVPEADIA